METSTVKTKLQEFVEKQLEFCEALRQSSPNNAYWDGEVTAFKIIERYLETADADRDNDERFNRADSGTENSEGSSVPRAQCLRRPVGEDGISFGVGNGDS